jgi:hypothetical protein
VTGVREPRWVMWAMAWWHPEGWGCGWFVGDTRTEPAPPPTQTPSPPSSAPRFCGVCDGTASAPCAGPCVVACSARAARSLAGWRLGWGSCRGLPCPSHVPRAREAMHHVCAPVAGSLSRWRCTSVCAYLSAVRTCARGMLPRPCVRARVRTPVYVGPTSRSFPPPLAVRRRLRTSALTTCCTKAKCKSAARLCTHGGAGRGMAGEGVGGTLCARAAAVVAAAVPPPRVSRRGVACAGSDVATWWCRTPAHPGPGHGGCLVVRYAPVPLLLTPPPPPPTHPPSIILLRPSYFVLWRHGVLQYWARKASGLWKLKGSVSVVDIVSCKWCARPGARGGRASPP